VTRIPLGRAYRLASATTSDLWQAGSDLISITPVGSLRRFAPDVGDVSLLAVTETGGTDALLKAVERLPRVKRTITRKQTSVTIATERGDVTIHAAERMAAGAALACLTGSVQHVAQLGALAESLRLRLAPGQLTDAAGVRVPCETEEHFYAHLHLPFIPPELRHGNGEIEAAQQGELPSLLSELHIRGDLHMHTTWSDGRDSMEAMVRASRALGYEYVAITDHSASSAASRSVALNEVVPQRTELRRVAHAHPNIQILHGIELEILPDGSLDFENHLLENFDIVLASLHNHAGQSADILTNRYLRAMANPYVNIITHPANRSPLDLRGYDLDWDRIFETARETGTALEIDGAPGHLDLDGTLANRAAAAGATLVVDSDCHQADALARQMLFGVATARRGWIGPQHVLNTGSVDDVRGFVARKRARG
jgi:DNA polymerase (family X)